MPLSARERSRYARQLLLPQIGESGQTRLLALRVRARPGGDEGALSVAATYLERAGVSVGEHRAASEFFVAPSAELLRIAGDGALLEAARALAGALAAVDVLRTAVGFGGVAQATIPSLSVLTEDV